MKPGYIIRKVYRTSLGRVIDNGISPTPRELADELAKMTTGFFGGVHPSEEQLEQLSQHITMSAIRWVNDEFDMGLK